MSTSLSHTPVSSPLQSELAGRRAELARLNEAIVRCQGELLALRNRLRSFETRYMQEVGVLYATLDDLEACIAEHEVSLYRTDTARARAAAAREQARATYEAAHGGDSAGQVVAPDAGLKRLFREVARRLHPDFAMGNEEDGLRTQLMARANDAYHRGDGDALQRLLDDSIDLLAADGGDPDPEADVARLARQVAHARRELDALERELAELPTGEMSQMKVDADAARLEGRDLLAELAGQLRERIADAGHRLRFTQRQVDAFDR